jgi:arabinose-5-phosphate isomerase
MPLLKRLGVPVIGLTGNPLSAIANMSTVNIDVSVNQEACPLGLAPTASTTAALAMGDAIAVALLEAKGFTTTDFALSHPGGALGKRLLLTVDDIMHTGAAIPVVSETANLEAALLMMTQKGLGATAIVDAGQYVVGIFTDGDLRRALNHTPDLRTTPIHTLMTVNPTTVHTGLLAAEALHVMENKRINALIVTNADNVLMGILNMHDLLRAKVL